MKLSKLSLFQKQEESKTIQLKVDSILWILRAKQLLNLLCAIKLLLVSKCLLHIIIVSAHQAGDFSNNSMSTTCIEFLIMTQFLSDLLLIG